MSSQPHYTMRQRLSAWIILSHYLFSLLLLTLPPGARANTAPDASEQTPQHFILYHKPLLKSWPEIEREKAPDVDNLELNQRELAQQYGLTLKEWLLLPASGPKSRLDIPVTLVKMGDKASPEDAALHWQTSPGELLALNQRVKTPEQMKALAGQWILVPQRSVPDAAATDEGADGLRDRMAAAWGSAQQSGAGNALRSTANGAVNAALTQEVESWLNHTGGKARVTADVGLGNGDSRDAGLDFLWPVKIWQDDILFTQMSAHRWNDRNILNLGLGLRHTFSPHLLAGGNLFFDQDVTRHHSRMGLGAELWSDRVRTSANYYLPVSGWRHSGDSVFNDDPTRYELYERAARGWDINVDTALSQHVSANVGWFQWYGDKVDVNGSRSEASSNPHGLKLGVNWQPIPLLGLSAEQSFISGQSDNFTVGLNFHWEFGRRLSQMLSADEASAMPSLMQSRTEFVTRNNNIVLAYKQKEKDWRLYFTPTEKSTPVGVPMLHAVKGGKGGVVRYASSSATIADVDEVSGQINPKQRGEVAITATETSATDSRQVFSSASYHLTVTPGDFAPSVAEVAIAGEMSPGQVLTGSYRYVSNEGEDEDPAQTQLRWVDKASGKVLKEGGASWKVRAEDMTTTLVFQVTPVNKKGVNGEAGMAEISGSATLSALRIDHLLTPGEIRPDGSVKFFAHDNGALLLVAEVKDDKGAPLADQWVHWQSKSALGKLSQNSVRTDAHGQALVKMEGIMNEGQGVVLATLLPYFEGASLSASPGQPQNQEIDLTIDFSRTQGVQFIQAPEEATVGSEQVFTVKATDQDGEPAIAGSEISWSSNGKPVATLGYTNDKGEATITLKAPWLQSGGWEVSASVAAQTPVKQSIALLADTSTAQVSELTIEHDGAAADGAEKNSVRAVVKDSQGNPVPGVKVSFKADNGATIAESGTTDEHGAVEATLTSTTAGRVTVTALAGGVEKTQTVTFIADTRTAKVSALEVVQNNAMADGVATNSVKVVVKDNAGNPVGEQVVSVTADKSTLVGTVGKTDANGAVTVTLTSPMAGDTVVTAALGKSSLTATTTFASVLLLKNVRLDKTSGLKVGKAIAVSADVDEIGGGQVDFLYQWYRSGTRIAGATQASYTLAPEDGGMLLQAEVTARNTVGKSDSQLSNKTDRVTGVVDRIAVTASADSVDADGTGKLIFTAKAVDNGGVSIPEEALTWSIDKPELVTIESEDTQTDVKGEGRLTLTVKSTGGDIRVQVMSGSKSGSADSQLRGTPVISNLSISGTPEAGETLTASYTFTANGAGNDVSTVIWARYESNQWIPLDGVTGRQYRLKPEDAGHRIKVVVEPKGDVAGSKTGLLQTSQPVDVTLKAAAALTGPAEVKGNEGETQSLTVGGGNGGPLSYSSGNETVVTVDSKGVLSFTGPGAATIDVRQAVNGNTAAPADLNVPVKVVGIPLIANLNISGTPEAGETLTASYTFTANGAGNDASAFIWARYESNQWTPLDGATGRQYRLQAKDAGHRIKVVVEPKGDVAGSKPGLLQTSQPVDVTLKAAAALTGPAEVKGNEGETQSLTVGGGNGGPLSYSSGNEAVVTVDSKGVLSLIGPGAATVTVRQAVNGNTAAPADLNVPVTVAGIPLVSNLNISGTPKAGETLTASYTFTANGAGGDNSAYQWQWYKSTSGTWENANIAGNKNKTFTPDDSYGGYSVRVVVTPKGNVAGSLEGSKVTSDPVQIIGTPKLTGLSITGTPRPGQPLTASYSFTANGAGADASTYQWQWYTASGTWENATLTGNKNKTFTPDESYGGYSVRVVVTPKGSVAGSSEGSKVTSAGLQIIGTPKATGLSISGTPKAGQPLTANYTFVANGAGADASTYQWQWYTASGTWENATLTGNKNKTFTPDDSYGGYSVRVVVTPKGSVAGSSEGSKVTSDPVQIIGTPKLTGLSITGTPRVGQQLTASYTFTANGAGNDVSTFSWARYEDDQWIPIPGVTGRQYLLQPKDAGYSIKVVVVPKGDVVGSQTGIFQSSKPVDVTSIPLSGKNVTVNFGASVTTLQISGGSGTERTFSSNNTRAVTVDATTGKLAFHQPGTAIVTVTEKFGVKPLTLSVTVRNVRVANLRSHGERIGGGFGAWEYWITATVKNDLNQVVEGVKICIKANNTYYEKWSNGNGDGQVYIDWLRGNFDAKAWICDIIDDYQNNPLKIYVNAKDVSASQ